MKILNLVDLDKSDIKLQDYQGNNKINILPDGQRDVTIGNYQLVHTCVISRESVQIKSRFNNFEDLNIILSATQALRKLGVKEIHLYIPYLLGARADRLFVEGGVSYLRDVVAPIINSQNYELVTVMDVHNPDMTAACINNLKVIDNVGLVNFTLSNLKYLDEELERYQKMSDLYTKNGYILISPDGGALKKIYKLADSIGYKGDIITCSKSRNTNGKLSKTIVPIEPKDYYKDKDYLIVDDICDGGATFINIAKELKEVIGAKAKIYLIVTHGIFSKEHVELSHYFDGIYTTNSYREITWGESGLIKQLNVF